MDKQDVTKIIFLKSTACHQYESRQGMKLHLKSVGKFRFQKIQCFISDPGHLSLLIH